MAKIDFEKIVKLEQLNTFGKRILEYISNNYVTEENVKQVVIEQESFQIVNDYSKLPEISDKKVLYYVENDVIIGDIEYTKGFYIAENGQYIKLNVGGSGKDYTIASDELINEIFNTTNSGSEV